MLVLTRRPGERIHIGDSVVVTVLAVDGDRVKIGISAPKHVQLLRGELLDEVASLNIGAARPAGHSMGHVLDELGEILSKGPKASGHPSEDSDGR